MKKFKVVLVAVAFVLASGVALATSKVPALIFNPATGACDIPTDCPGGPNFCAFLDPGCTSPIGQP